MSKQSPWFTTVPVGWVLPDEEMEADLRRCLDDLRDVLAESKAQLPMVLSALSTTGLAAYLMVKQLTMKKEDLLALSEDEGVAEIIQRLADAIDMEWSEVPDEYR